MTATISKQKKSTIQILVDKISIPIVFLWKWSEKDYEKSLELTTDGYKVDFNFLFHKLLEDQKINDRETPIYGKLVITIDKPDKIFLDGLKNQTQGDSQLVAEKIYNIYNSTIQKVVSYSRWTANIQNILDGSSTGFEEMFGKRGFLSSTTHVSWRAGNNDFQSFQPKLKKTKRKVHPMFKSEKLLTVKKWRKITDFAKGDTSILNKETDELLRIKSRAMWGEKRIPAIETAALMEALIKNKVQRVLEERGQSKNKIENASKEVGLSTLLNLFLPLILNKSEVRRYKKYIDNLDKLRGIRNDIMHKNFQDKDIDKKSVVLGIEAAIKITQILSKKFIS